VFEVLDDGPGPSSAVAERIFDAFVTTKPEGIGLGLAAARQSADDLGGTLTWDRNDGRTRFRLVVPLAGSQG
jgi:nitrogen-specific signal transduction histidine kinase